MNNVNLAFIICTEAHFERKSILLARSIRQFGGRISRAPIFSYSPRKVGRISSFARRELERCEVHHSETVLNDAHTDYGPYNKPFICSHAEQTLAFASLVFLDSDKIIVNEPAALDLPESTPVTVRPVDLVNIGTYSPNSDQMKYWAQMSKLFGATRFSVALNNNQYWRKLYKLCGVEVTRSIVTAVDQIEILEYFNSAMISVRRSAGVFSQWEKNFRKVMSRGLRPSHPFFIEQSTFSATVSALGGAAVLPESYNWPGIW